VSHYPYDDLSDPDYYNQLVKGNVWEAKCENGNRREVNNTLYILIYAGRAI